MVLMEFSKEDIQRAKDIDMMELFRREGFTVKKCGSYYTTEEMDSIRIYPHSNTYVRFSKLVSAQKGKSGGSPIDFMMNIRGTSYIEALRILLGKESIEADLLPKRKQYKELPPKESVLPKRASGCGHVYMYLMKRGISKKLIDECVNNGVLYQSAEYHNCVFVGTDKFGNPKYACMRGISDNDGKSFKIDVEGSDKRFAFKLIGTPKSESVYVFESPIDALSFATHYNAASLNLLTLGCVCDKALVQFLQDNPRVKNICLCLDNDKKGIEAMDVMKKIYSEKGYNVKIRQPVCGKDWNEVLMNKLVSTNMESLKQKAQNRERGL